MVSSARHFGVVTRQDGVDSGTIGESEGETMGEIGVIGLDLAKQVFHVVGFDARGKEVNE